MMALKPILAIMVLTKALVKGGCQHQLVGDGHGVDAKGDGHEGHNDEGGDSEHGGDGRPGGVAVPQALEEGQLEVQQRALVGEEHLHRPTV
ncbi:hypothetical protein HaLaN_15877, partial [Haematococcus lacustris]